MIFLTQQGMGECQETESISYLHQCANHRRHWRVSCQNMENCTELGVGQSPQSCWKWSDVLSLLGWERVMYRVQVCNPSRDQQLQGGR